MMRFCVAGQICLALFLALVVVCAYMCSQLPSEDATTSLIRVISGLGAIAAALGAFVIAAALGPCANRRNE